jgi:hypothetical protein
MTVLDTRAAYLISLVELQLNRKGYYIQREVQLGNRRVDALAESTEATVSKGSLPVRFGIEYKVTSADSLPHRKPSKTIDRVPWFGGQVDVFRIYLYPAEQIVRVPKPLRETIKSEQSMTVKGIN